MQCTDAADYFPGLEVNGLGTETLILKHITGAMNGWCVEAQFWNGQKHLESAGAEITIVDSEGNPIRRAAAPTRPPTTTNPAPHRRARCGQRHLPVDDNAKTANISVQPESIEVEPGDAHTLSVIATSPNNGSLSYQWYSASTDNINAALPISGAADASYTIEKADETMYYWVAVWNTKDGARSQAVYSEAAEVSIGRGGDAHARSADAHARSHAGAPRERTCQHQFPADPLRHYRRACADCPDRRGDLFSAPTQQTAGKRQKQEKRGNRPKEKTERSPPIWRTLCFSAVCIMTIYWITGGLINERGIPRPAPSARTQ